MNHSINFFRLIFTFVIAFWHFPMLSGEILRSGYIVVEFFFILSGYFLYNSSRKNITTIEYTKNRINKFWLKSTLVTILITLITLIASHRLTSYGFIEYSQYLAKIAFLLQNIIPFNKELGMPNAPLWYLTTLIYCGTIIYAIIRTFPKQYKFLLLMICMTCYLIVFNYHYNTELPWEYPLSLPRGLAGISLGCLINSYVNENSNTISNKLLNTISILSLIISTIGLFVKGIHNAVNIICYCFIIIACLKNKTFIYKIFNRPLFSKLSSTSFEIFIGHMFVIICTRNFLRYTNIDITQSLDWKEKIIGSAVYIISLFIFGYLYQKMCNHIQSLLNLIFK